MDWKIWSDSAILDEANIDALFSSNIGGSLTFPVEGTFKDTHTFIHRTALELELGAVQSTKCEYAEYAEFSTLHPSIHPSIHGSIHLSIHP